jgi:hypothetical protein
MGWKVAFTEVAGAVNYCVVDPSQHWINTQAGSAHVTLHSPAFVQGGSGSASFVIYSQAANGTWSSASPAAAPSKVVGALPAFTNPYWVYANGTYNWSGDFSQPGGDTNTMLPQYGGTGAAVNPNDVEIDWFYTGDSSFPSGAVRIVNSVTGNFSPAIPGYTVDLIAHAYGYWTALIKPTYANANYNLKFEGQNDAVVSALLPSLAKYVTAPTAGVFTQNAVNHVNIPFSAFAVNAPVYKMILQQNNGTQGVWLVGQLGLANSPQ